MIAEQINQVVNMVAQKLGVAVEAVYPMLIKQAEVFRSVYSVGLWIFGFAVVMILVGLILYHIANNGTWNEGLELAALITLAIFIIVFVISGIILLMQLNDYFTALYNPEWWAIEYVTRLVK